jgi:hypothetical protein
MTTNTAMPRMASIAPLIDHLQDIACEEIPAPRTCSVTLWDDGDYDVSIYHKHGADETEAIYYDASTGDVVWKYVKNGEWVVDEDADDGEGYGTAYVQSYEESDERTITTIEPPGKSE